jgi:hypothetical protein
MSKSRKLFLVLVFLLKFIIATLIVTLYFPLWLFLAIVAILGMWAGWINVKFMKFLMKFFEC